MCCMVIEKQIMMCNKNLIKLIIKTTHVHVQFDLVP